MQSMGPAVQHLTSARNVLSIQVLGKFELRLDGRLVDLSSRKARALLGYLVLNESPEATRERIVGLMWSDSDEERARGSLRQCLREIRTALPDTVFDGLLADRLEIKLDPSCLDVDLWSALSDARDGRVPLRLLDGPTLVDDILVELQSVDEQFGSWLIAKRQTLKERLLRFLEVPLRRLVQEEDEAMLVSRAILNLDSTHEEAARKLMRTLAARGDGAGAQRVYKRLWDVLADEFDSEPDQQTQAVIAEIKFAIPFSGSGSSSSGIGPEHARDVTPGAATAPAGSTKSPVEGTASASSFSARALLSSSVRSALAQSPADRPMFDHESQPAIRANRIARPEGTKLVLSIAPFALSGADGSPAYILQGFRRELIACLVRFREWVVREGTGNVDTPGSNLEEYVLEADGLCIGQGVHLSLTLKDVASNDYLWSEILDLNLETLFDAQKSVVRRITTALNVHVSANRMALIAPRPDENLRAYDQWLRGQAYLLTYEPAGWQKASEIFGDIIVRTPSFSPAYSSLAQLQNTIHFVHPGVSRTNGRTEEALQYARSATRLDPIDSRAQLSLGWAHAMSGQHDQAATHHTLAHELNDNDPWTLVSAALGFAFRGTSDRSKKLADHALSLSLTPSPAHWRYQAMIRYMNGDYEACLAAAQEAETSIANVLVWKAAALNHLGQTEAARRATDKFFQSVASRWFDTKPAGRETMTRWFLSAFPIAKLEDWERLRDDFAGAGAPVEGIGYLDC